jgi:SAM-dependent methyltransferase
MKILIGIPCYNQVSPETLEDYCRLAYYCGRRLPQHEFLIGIKTKTEQYRARNAIVEGALQTGCDYLMFLDDDHVIDWEGTSGPNSRYAMIDQLLAHFEKDEKLGLVGAVYFHRGNQCRPVLMREGKDGAFYWLRDDEITGELQEVGVQGGGCMMLRMKAFDKIQSPWFEPESTAGLGTDLQICKKMREAGYKVACDTSIQIGHVLAQRTVITPQNRHRVAMENAKTQAGGDEGIQQEWLTNSALNLYRLDAEEYLGTSADGIHVIANQYKVEGVPTDHSKLEEYYASKGNDQLARQVMFHHTPAMKQQMEFIHNMVNTGVHAHGAEFGCGSAPVSFELAKRGHTIDFIDIDGSGAYEFTKWRVKKHGLNTCGFTLTSDYDYILMLDSIEHIADWQPVLMKVIAALKEKGAFITNYFRNEDYKNPEHVSMDKAAVRKFLIENGVYPLNDFLWVKQSHLAKEVAA